MLPLVLDLILVGAGFFGTISYIERSERRSETEEFNLPKFKRPRMRTVSIQLSIVVRKETGESSPRKESLPAYQ